MEPVKGLGKRLKDLRIERGLTMEMVVDGINIEFNTNITKGHLSKWENDVNSPALRFAAYLCLFYDVSLDYLLGLTDEKTPAYKIKKEA